MAFEKKLADRLVHPTFFEIEGWRRIEVIPLAFESFGFEPSSITLEYEFVDLPISIGNCHMFGPKEKFDRPTFLVCIIQKFEYLRIF